MITEETIARVKFSLLTTKSFVALEVIEELEKENAELKKKIEELDKLDKSQSYKLLQEVEFLKKKIAQMDETLSMVI